MELKEYIKIFKDNYGIFLMTVGLVLASGLIAQLVLKDKYSIEADLNITRTGYQKDTSDYRYDEFYRLQADERFADTVVRWIGSEVIKNEISKETKGVKFEKLKAERLSSQMIRVSFVLLDKDEAEKVTRAIDRVLNDKVSELNSEQKNPQWFKVLVSYPIVDNYGVSLGKLTMILLVAGLFLGFWAVLIKHYLK
ncbi:MAG: hypothetical protein UR66_C0009G0141 [Candidatus Moranbacteria bacterium GW2011_GWE1_35_17]|nr:MAG: hypothetical protein UR66_C0009G0141 [Candidatus Moranbacteria bacterium GW2011_GWE1_35_17]KKP81425.1 MAG: hypothetical protein UR82_C0064G0007 [Candidatus Moranbacteria bacterium GW2011_GWF1_35_5]KKP84959.1 MAG: hypothetical protein UR83_C0007G0005 [Candidatus Moranbacteria bacterium GW2011_GWF2_35_54]